MARHRKFTPEFKAQVVLEVLSGAKTAAEVCRQHSIKPQLLSDWKANFLANAAKVFQSDDRTNQEQARIAELERLVGRLTLELEVAKKASMLWPSVANRSERWP